MRAAGTGRRTAPAVCPISEILTVGGVVGSNTTGQEAFSVKRLLPPLALGAALLLIPAAWAAGQATPDEAKAMALKAAAYLTPSSMPRTASGTIATST